MDPSSIIKLIILLLLLLLSAFFSSAETALTTVSRHKLKFIANEGSKKANRLLKLVDNPSKMLSAILIGNNIVNISASALTTILVTEAFGNRYIGVATGILTILVLIFGEITPKTFATVYTDKLALLYGDIISVLTFILTPVIWILDKLTAVIFFILRINPSVNKVITEGELKTIVNASHEDGVIENEEKNMITNVVDFGNSHVKDIMIPRVDVCLLSIDAAFQDIVDAYSEEQFTRIPVYEDTKDNIVGIINIKDLFYYIATNDPSNLSIKDIMREPYYTYEYQKTNDLLNDMKTNSISMAIVLDEYGVAAGVITIEDLLEEIVGEINDEYDIDSSSITELAKNIYQVDASTNIDDINDVLDTSISSDDYDSIGGHIIEILDHLPEVGEIAIDGNITYKVLSLDKNRIDQVKIVISPPEDSSSNPIYE